VGGLGVGCDGDEASHDARLAAACWRVQGAVEALTESGPGRGALVERPSGNAEWPSVEAERPSANGEPALAHLHGLERALAELAQPLGAGSGSRLAGA
jgi:hypothetical protein